MNIKDLEWDDKVVQKVAFQRALVVIPQCIEESHPQSLEKWVKKLPNMRSKEVYVDFPSQIEAFPVYIDDKFCSYTLYGDVYADDFQLKTEEQFRSFEEWENLVKRTRNNLQE